MPNLVSAIPYFLLSMALGFHFLQDSSAQNADSFLRKESGVEPGHSINFSEEEFETWKVEDNKAKDFDVRILPSGDGNKQALRLQYQIVTDGPDPHREVPASISLVKSGFGANFNFPNDVSASCELRVKASQPRTIRIFMTDASDQNFLTEQFLVTTEWQTISIPISRNFWNRWFPTPDRGAVHDDVIWPLKNFRIDLLFAQSAGHLKHAGGGSINPPESFWIESVVVKPTTEVP